MGLVLYLERNAPQEMAVCVLEEKCKIIMKKGCVPVFINFAHSLFFPNHSGKLQTYPFILALLYLKNLKSIK